MTAHPGYIGNYRILEYLGEGGSARVLRAQHITLQRDVAIKQLSPTVAASEEGRSRFVDEARLLAALNHPNVIDVHDFAIDDDGTPYCVMELAEGTTLADRIVDREVSLTEALTIAMALADALAAVHDAGILHRDVKTENVVVVDTPDGPCPKLIDFGIARATAHPRRAHTIAGLAIGTPRAMAPEQISGTHVDARTDVWAFGILLFELLNRGVSPFECHGNVQRTLKGALTSPHPPLEAWVPGPLRELIARCLSKLPEGRPQSMREVHAALAQIAADNARAQEAFAAAVEDTSDHAQVDRAQVDHAQVDRAQVDRAQVDHAATAVDPPHVPPVCVAYDDLDFDLSLEPSPYEEFEVEYGIGSRIATFCLLTIIGIGGIGAVMTALMQMPI